MAKPAPVLGSNFCQGPMAQFVLPGFSVTNISINGSEASLSWANGTPPFLVYGSPTLNGSWSAVGNNLLPRTKTFPVDQNQFWRVQSGITNSFTATTNSQPRLNWTAPDTDMSDALGKFLIEKSTTTPDSWSAIAGHDAGEAAGTYLSTTRQANDASTVVSPYLKYRITQVTQNGVTIPYNMPSLTPAGQPSGSVLLARNIGSTGYSFITASCTDASGNLFVGGGFNGTVDFGGITKTAGSQQDVFIAKYNAATGALIWVSQGGGSAVLGQPLSMVLDSSGNIVFTATWPNGAIHKYDPSGNLIWTHGPVKTGPNNLLDTYSLAVDTFDNIFLTGHLSTANYPTDPTQIDFGNGFLLHSVPGVPKNMAFLAKYSSSGTCLNAFMVRTFGGTSHGWAVDVDKRINPATSVPYNEVILFGSGDASLSWDPSAAPFLKNIANSQSFSFLVRFQNDLTFIWQKIAADGVVSQPQCFERGIATCMKLDSQGRIIISGTFNYGVNLGGGDRVLSSVNNGMYSAGYTSSGDWIWDLADLSQGELYPDSIAIDAQDNPIVCGHYHRANSFGGKPLFPSEQNQGNNNCYVAKFIGTTGTVTWVGSWGGGLNKLYNTLFISVVVDSYSNIWAGGQMNGPVTVGTFALTPTGGTPNILMIKLSP